MKKPTAENTNDQASSTPQVRSEQEHEVTPFNGWNRRDFLRAAGFSIAGAVLASCERAPITKALPYVNQPDGIIVGQAKYFASTCTACSANCGILVKCRDGRPIKLEGNPEHPISRGGLCAVGQASILSLYDSHRLQQPLIKEKVEDWPTLDRALLQELATIRDQGKAIRFLTGNITSPTTQQLIDEFLASFPDAKHVWYEALASSAIADAHAKTHGVNVVPHYHFDRAEVIVSFDADFLGTWISPVEFTAGYTAGRSLEGELPRFSHHTQYEARMSLTGSKADDRLVVSRSEAFSALNHLAALVADKAGVPFPAINKKVASKQISDLHILATRLWKARRKSLVVCGCQDIPAQILCNFINELLDNYGTTLDIKKPSFQRRGISPGFVELLHEMTSGQVGALFLFGVNPVYDLPNRSSWKQAIGKVSMVVNLGNQRNETAQLANYTAPDHDNLESWGDHEPVSGPVGFRQPAIRPLGNSRGIWESLAIWAGKPRKSYDILSEQYLDRSQRNQAIHDGFMQVARAEFEAYSFNSEVVKPETLPQQPDKSLELVVYPKVAMLDGSHAYNPWLLELPDPISKVSWDNYALLSPLAAKQLGVQDGDMIELNGPSQEGGNTAGKLPVVVQPGQHDGVVAVALGYGAEASRRFANVGPRWIHEQSSVGTHGLVGVNAAPWLRLNDGILSYELPAVRITRTVERREMAFAQRYDSTTLPENLAPAGHKPRPNIQETTFSSSLHDNQHHPTHEELWPDDHPYTGHHWGMTIDLTKCTGCSACVIACQAENNIPVVGKDEVRRNRHLHWIRIDRYFSECNGHVDVAYQPMLCHHCDNAPCETVCPVLATVHSKEGLNQQVYNRCVGTRYCSNNCPYKVRKFNWFNYPRIDDRYRLVLNPDVTVRSRGVMEKCSFCVQRIQEAKLAAKQEHTLSGKSTDSAIIVQPACQQSCPAGAITFGDMNNSESAIAHMLNDPRNYRVLEELNVRPSVSYLTLVRNRPAKPGRSHHG